MHSAHSVQSVQRGQALDSACSTWSAEALKIARKRCACQKTTVNPSPFPPSYPGGIVYLCAETVGAPAGRLFLGKDRKPPVWKVQRLALLVFWLLFMNRLQDRGVSWNTNRRDKLAANAAAAILAGRQNSNSDFIRVTSQLHDRDPAIREAAVTNLGGIGGQDAIRAAARLIRDGAPNVRAATCHALGRMRAHTVKRELYDALSDSDVVVKCAAAGALAQMGDKAGLPQIKALLKQRGPQQYRALRTFNLITNKKLPISQCGVRLAMRYLKTLGKSNKQ